MSAPLTFGFPDFSSRRGFPKHTPPRVEEAGKLVQGAAERPGAGRAVGRGGRGTGAGLPGVGPGGLHGGIWDLGEGAAGPGPGGRVWLWVDLGRLCARPRFPRAHRGGLRREGQVRAWPVGLALFGITGRKAHVGGPESQR